ncbi:MAG: amidohydrolase family protein [Deltaproteobacteria bacterium]
MIVDFEHHYMPEKLARKKGFISDKVTYVENKGIRSVTVHSKLYDIGAQLGDMDEAGVDILVLSCVVGWDAALEDCCLINDDMADLQRKYPNRFVGLAHVPVLEGKKALAELERAISNLDLHGVTIASQIEGLALDSPQLYDFYSRVEELDVPIYVHPAPFPEGYALVRDYDLGRVLGRELDLTVAATRIIAGGILDRFPSLKFVISHFGGGISAVKDRLIAKSYRFGTLKRPFEEYFDMLYFDTAGFEGGLTALHCALLGIRPDRLVFGTDYPQDFTGVNTDLGKGMGSIREYISAIRSIDLQEELKEGILGKTAARLLKLKGT